MSNSKKVGASTLDLKEETFTYTWTITNLNVLTRAKVKSDESPEFAINDKKWYLSFSYKINSSYTGSGWFYFIDLHKTASNDITNYHYSFAINDENNKPNKQISRSQTLYDESKAWQLPSTIIPNGCSNVKIICDVKFVTRTQTNFEDMADGDFKSASSDISKSEYLKNLFLDDQFSDVNLVTPDGKELKAHKNILASASSAFAAMFKHDMVEKNSNIVKIADFEYDVIKEMLRFIYMGEVENIKSISIELFLAADKYDIQSLRNKCANYIANNITVDNAIKIYDLANKFNAEKLKTRAMDFLKSTIGNMMKTDAFEEKIQQMGAFSEVIQSIIQ